MKIPSIVWIILVLVLGFGFLVVVANNRNAQNSVNATLPVMAEVYVDFNCPHCADFEPYVKAAREKYGDKLNISIKNLPFLTSGQNPDTSVQYATAAIAARNQGKGVEYTESLFKWITYLKNPNNSTYEYSDREKTFFSSSNIDVVALAEFLGLNVETFQNDLVSETTKATLRQEKENIVKIMGAPSTPAVVFYGKLFKMSSFDDLDRQIQAYITQAEANQNKQ
jgi:predicted DsbA family dithiol-disulfide isomerase